MPVNRLTASLPQQMPAERWAANHMSIAVQTIALPMAIGVVALQQQILAIAHARAQAVIQIPRHYRRYLASLN